MFVGNWTHATMKNVKKWKFDLYLLSQSTFRFYNIYLIMCEICNKNISNENYKKLWNCLFKMKNGIQLFLEKGSLLQLKGTFVWQRDTWIIRRAGGGRILANLKLSLTHLVQIKKNFFFSKKGHF